MSLTDPLEFEFFDFEVRFDASRYEEKARRANILRIATDALVERNLVAPNDTVIFVGQALCDLARQLQGQKSHPELRRRALRAYRLLNERIETKSLNRFLTFDKLKRVIDREYEEFAFMFSGDVPVSPLEG